MIKMGKKTKNILIFISLTIIVLIAFIAIKLTNDGFRFFNYATENYLEIQLQDFLSKESGQDYKNKIFTIGQREYAGCTLMFYKADDYENIIVDYENKGSFGKHKIFNLERIIKSKNSISMIDIYDNNKRKYVILSGLDREEFSSINIISKKTDKILEQIDLGNLPKDEFNIAELSSNSIVLEYTPKSDIEIKLELNKKSGN